MAEFTTRTPLATYEKAVWRLAQWDASERYTPEQLELAVQVVADVFWLSDAKVMHDMKKAIRAIDASPLPVSRRVALSHWGL